MKTPLTRTMNHQLGFKIQAGEGSWEGAPGRSVRVSRAQKVWMNGRPTGDREKLHQKVSDPQTQLGPNLTTLTPCN